MFIKRRNTIAVWLLPWLLAGGAWGQVRTDTPDTPWEGELTGTNVRVRSGAGLDFYPTTKLHTGDHVLVFGEKLGWYRIAPPPNSFSYIDMSDVERSPGARHGIVKRDGVFVRAGSQLVTRKSSTQMTLNKAARVEIIGEADGFYKITPPRGAFLHISKDYVKRVPKHLRTGLAERYAGRVPTSSTRTRTGITRPLNQRRPPAGHTPNNRPPTQGRRPGPGAHPQTNLIDGPPITIEPTIESLQDNARALDKPKLDKTARTTHAPAASPVRPSGRFQALLTAIETDFQATMRLPLKDRKLEPLIQRYTEIANQKDERIPAQYAAIRIEQLKNLGRIRRATAQLKTDGEDLDAFRSKMRADRLKIARARAEERTRVKFDLQGELRKSYAFAPEKRRFRLVDPKRLTTIAYVEVPRSVMDSADPFLGRLVGVRVSGQQFSTAARIPIAVASSLTDLTPRPTGRSAAIIPGESSNRPNTSNRLANTTDEKGRRPDAEMGPSKTAVATGKEEAEQGDD
ncbi:MAG: SH3 domain-containing protein [Phycisphaerae bacterium]